MISGTSSSVLQPGHRLRQGLPGSVWEPSFSRVFSLRQIDLDINLYTRKPGSLLIERDSVSIETQNLSFTIFSLGIRNRNTTIPCMKINSPQNNGVDHRQAFVKTWVCFCDGSDIVCHGGNLSSFDQLCVPDANWDFVSSWSFLKRQTNLAVCQ